jgi:mono/diheme cytochrome c family protein
VASMRAKGYLESGVWTKAYVRRHYPQLIDGDRIDPKRLVERLDRREQIDLGGVIFQHHCNDCHATTLGYSAAGPLVQGWRPQTIRALIRDLHEKRFTMPPWSGTPEEADLLAAYLHSIAPPPPKGMRPPATRAEAD